MSARSWSWAYGCVSASLNACLPPAPRCAGERAERLAQVLLDGGADPRLKNAWNRSCIHRAMFYGRQEAQDMMLRHVGLDYDDREIADIARFESVPLSRAEQLRSWD